MKRRMLQQQMKWCHETTAQSLKDNQRLREVLRPLVLSPPPRLLRPPIKQEIDLTMLDDEDDGTAVPDKPPPLDPTTIVTPFMIKNTTLIFTNDSDMRIKEKDLSQCLTVHKLFIYAHAIFNVPSQREIAVRVKVQMQESENIVEGDEGEFETFLKAVRDDACWVVKPEEGEAGRREAEMPGQCPVAMRDVWHIWAFSPK